MSENNVPIVMDLGSVGPARHMIMSRKDAVSLQEYADSHCTPSYRVS